MRTCLIVLRDDLEDRLSFADYMLLCLVAGKSFVMDHADWDSVEGYENRHGEQVPASEARIIVEDNEPFDDFLNGEVAFSFLYLSSDASMTSLRNHLSTSGLRYKFLSCMAVGELVQKVNNSVLPNTLVVGLILGEPDAISELQKRVY